MAMNSTVIKWTEGIIGFIVLILVVANLYPTYVTSANDLNSSGLPLASLFQTGGLVPVLIGVGILLVALSVFMKKGGNKRRR